jgi:hypothetical protein
MLAKEDARKAPKSARQPRQGSLSSRNLKKARKGLLPPRAEEAERKRLQLTRRLNKSQNYY